MDIGKVKFAEGEYIGQVSNGMANGFGKMVYDNGDLYLGEWRNNCQTGKGVKVTKNYDALGSFVNGKRHGSFCCVDKKVVNCNPNKDYWWNAYYIGEYRDDVKCGQGAYVEGCNGSYAYIGTFANDRLNGRGYYASHVTFSFGYFEAGDYVNGKVVGNRYRYPRIQREDKEYLSTDPLFYGEGRYIRSDNTYKYWGFGVACDVSAKGLRTARIGYHNTDKQDSFKGVMIKSSSDDKMAVSHGEWNYIYGKKNGFFSSIDYNGCEYIGNYRDGNHYGKGMGYDKKSLKINDGDYVVTLYCTGNLYMKIHPVGGQKTEEYCLDGTLYSEEGKSSVRLGPFELPAYQGVLNGGGHAPVENNKNTAQPSVPNTSTATSKASASSTPVAPQPQKKREKTIDDYFEEFKYEGPYADLTIDDMPSVGCGKGNVGSAKPSAPKRTTTPIKTSTPVKDYSPSTPTEKIYDYGDEYGQTLSFAERVKLEIANRKEIRAAKKAEKEKAKKAAEKKKAKALNSSAKKTSAKVKIAKPVKTPLAFEIDENGLVVVGEGAKSIGPKDFESVRKEVTTIRFASSVKKIEQRALYVVGNREYKKLTAVDLSATDDLSIEAEAFSYQSALVAVLFPHNLKYIGMKAFDRCNSLTVCDLSETTSDFDVDQWAFGHCASLESVVLPHTTYVGSFAFAECRALTSFDAPCANRLWDGVFYGDSSLQTVNVPNVMRIEKDAFCGCDELSEVIVHAKCKIKFGAFPKGLRKKKKKVGNTKVITFSKK